MPEVWLICEGGTDDGGGIDQDVISRVFTQVLSAGIAVASAGGEKGLKAAASFLRRQRPDCTVAYISDRDYRRRAEADASFADGTPGFIWRWHEIENYLLHPAVVVETFKRLKGSLQSAPGGLPPWARSLPEAPEPVTAALRECAAAIAPREAGRMCLCRLREETSETVGRVQFREPSFADPQTDVCRQAVLAETARIVAKAGEAAACPVLAGATVSARYDEILAHITSPTYSAAMQFLEEFSGHDLLCQCQARLCPRVSIRTLLTELAKALPDVYRAQRDLYGADDFRDLANGERALGGLPPV